MDDGITRRETVIGSAAMVLTGLAASAPAAGAPARKSAAKAEATARDWANPELIKHIYSAPKLINVPRAYEIMDRYKLSGLVASIPHNIYYLSSHSGIMQWMGRHFSTYAFFPRDENAPPALIIPGTMLYHLDYRPTWIENIKPISSPMRGPDGAVLLKPNGDPRAVEKAGIWPVRDGAEMKRGDLVQLALFAEFDKATTASALQGLKEAIVAGGGGKARVGFDDPRIGAWLGEIGLTDMQTVDAANVFKEIRLAKTAPEIALLRQAAQLNEQALDYAIDQIVPGMPVEDIEWAHARRWSQLKGQAKWLIVNINGVNSGEVSKGDFMKLDSVGTFKGYHGDVGRTVVVGPPTDELARRIDASTRVSRQVYAAIRPGMKYSEASSMFSALMRDEGFAVAFAAPHDVGLEHTDHPWPTGGSMPGSIAPADFVFHEGTVFTLDMPHNEMGWGTTHVEDMIHIRKDGFEPLSSMKTELRVRPA